MQAVLEKTEDTFEVAMELMQEPSRTGAALTIFNMDAEKSICFTAIVGVPPKEKLQKYYGFSIEKARRLLALPDNVSSYQSRDPENDRWGGAIRSEPIIISISGFPELWDEAISLTMAVRASSLRLETAREIAAISGNPHFERLFHKLP